MKRLSGVAVLLAVCLVGCSANKDFEKDILGHPAGAPSNASIRPQTPPPPPPPPPAPTPAPAPNPVVLQDQGNPRPESAAAATAPAPVARATARPVAPAAPVAAAPVTVPAKPAPAPAAASKPASPQAVEYTFQVGSFAHAEHAQDLVRKLEAKGFHTRTEEGKVKNRPYYSVFATRAGSRASLEGDLFAVGVTEPVLTAEGHPNAPGQATAVPAKAAPTPAAAKAVTHGAPAQHAKAAVPPSRKGQPAVKGHAAKPAPVAKGKHPAVKTAKVPASGPTATKPSGKKATAKTVAPAKTKKPVKAVKPTTKGSSASTSTATGS